MNMTHLISSLACFSVPHVLKAYVTVLKAAPPWTLDAQDVLVSTMPQDVAFLSTRSSFSFLNTTIIHSDEVFRCNNFLSCSKKIFWLLNEPVLIILVKQLIQLLPIHFQVYNNVRHTSNCLFTVLLLVHHFFLFCINSHFYNLYQYTFSICTIKTLLFS